MKTLERVHIYRNYPAPNIPTINQHAEPEKGEGLLQQQQPHHNRDDQTRIANWTMTQTRFQEKECVVVWYVMREEFNIFPLQCQHLTNSYAFFLCRTACVPDLLNGIWQIVASFWTNRLVVMVCFNVSGSCGMCENNRNVGEDGFLGRSEKPAYDFQIELVLPKIYKTKNWDLHSLNS